MSNLNSYTYICSAGLASVTSAGSLGPYFSLTHFLPIYDFRLDKNICDTSAINVSSLNYTSATHSSLSGFETIYNNSELSGFGSYEIKEFNALYYKNVSGTGPLFTGSLQKTGSNKVNSLSGKVLQPLVSATSFISTTAPGNLSAVGSYQLLTNGNVLSWNPLSASSTSWNFRNLYRVVSYSPNANTTPGICKGNYKCRIPAGTGSFKFNMLAIYATRVNEYGYYDPGVIGSPYNPTLFAIVCFDTPQEKYDAAGSMNAFEANVELQFSLQSSAASPVYLNTDYFTRIPTSNVTSAYALNYDGDVVISCSANPGSWVPKAKLTVTDSEKNQLHLAYDGLRYTDITTKSFAPYPTYPPTANMSVLDIDTACPDDALIQAGPNCEATGIKSIALGCYSSATGYADNTPIDFGNTEPDPITLYQSGRGGYTFAYGVENLSQGLASTTFGYGNSAIGFGSFAGGHLSLASSDMNSVSIYYSAPSDGLNFAYGFKTSAVGDSDNINPDGTSLSSIWTWLNNVSIYGGNAALNVQTLAKGNANVSLNMNTTTYGTCNFATGFRTSAIGNINVATGINTLAKNILSQAHGDSTSALSIMSYAYAGNAIADEKAKGSFTFGGPSIQGSGNETYSIIIPGYRYISISNGEDSVQDFSYYSISISQYEKTYNNSVGSFVFGLASSATDTSNHSILFGIKNKISGQNSKVFGNMNDVSYSSDYSSIFGESNALSYTSYSHIIGSLNSETYSSFSNIVGNRNILTASQYNTILGFTNQLTNSDQINVLGSNNIASDDIRSTYIGFNNIGSKNNYSYTLGRNNSIISATNCYTVGVGNTIYNSVNSFAIGNSVTAANVTNSVSIGFGSVSTVSNSVNIGSCNLSELNLKSPVINIDAKSCNLGTSTSISIKADKITLDGYTGNIEKYKYAVGYSRYRFPQGSEANIKICKMRCDEFSGKVETCWLNISHEPGKQFYCFITNDPSAIRPSTPTSPFSYDLVKYVMFNPTTFKFFIGTDDSNMDEYFKNGYVLLMYSETNVLDPIVDYYLFNDVNKFYGYVIAKDSSNDTHDYIHSTCKFNQNGQSFTSDTEFNIITANDNARDVYLTFISRSGQTRMVDTADDKIFSAYRIFTTTNGFDISDKSGKRSWDWDAFSNNSTIGAGMLLG